MNCIVAVDENWGIGYQGNLLFRISDDMKMFKALTTGGKVIMGRKTLESFPGGKPLPNRMNIVITRNEDYQCEGATVVHSTEEAARVIIGERHKTWVIGGAEIYHQMLDSCYRVYVTKILSEAKNVDTYFPNLDMMDDWKIVNLSGISKDPKTGLEYQFLIYERTK